MADSKVSQLTAATTPLAGTELVYLVQGGNSRRATAQAIAGLVPGTDLSYDAATRLLASSTGADVTLPVATASLPGLMAAADKALTDALIAAGVTAAGSVVTIPHIHGDLAGSVYIHVKNTSGGQLVKGTPVRVTGAVGDTTTLEVAAADATTVGTMPAIGILGDTLANNASGHAVVGGELTGLGTGSYSIGQALYVAAGGGLTGVKPTTGTVQQVAIVGRVHASTGSVTVTISAQLNPNWDTAYSERLRWDGGASGLDAATGRASLGLGSLATQSGTFSGTSSGTNTGDVTLAASVADVLSVSGQELQADDPGADRLVFWDDSAGKLTHLTLGTNLTITGTTLDAAGGSTDLGYTASTRLLTSSTGADVTLPLATTSDPGLMAAADKVKLDGVAAGATANSTDAQLRDRSTHTGTQSASTITGLATVATTGAYADLTGKPTLGTSASLDVAAAGDAAAGQVVKGNDSRLTDARTPTAHTQTASTISDSTAAGRALLTAADAAAQRTSLGLATVAATGAYSDLSGKPTIPAAADAAPLALGAAAAIGTSTDYAREDHVHARPSASDIGAAASGAITGSGITMATARLLGRTTASTGAVEEISVGSGLSLSGGTLTATGGGGGGAANYQEFTSSGTWTKPAGVTFIYVECVSGGGGGGSGRRGAAGTVRCGGGGAASGKIVSRWMPASLAGATETVTVGAGGTGGAAATVNDTNGSNGNNGGSSSFGSLLITPAAFGGSGGSTSAGSAGTVSYYGVSTSGQYAASGSSASTTGGPGTVGNRASLGPGSGSAGGGISASNVDGNGGIGGQGFGEQKNSAASNTLTGGGGTAGSAGGSGGNGTGLGDGGGGGAGSSTAAAGAGGNGAFPGGGGGGGGASLNGFNSGAGGNGGAGYVRVWSW